MAKILLVDDDTCLSGMISQWLRQSDHIVETADSGFAALEQLQFDTYEIIILDWQLPELTGIEICKKFRAAGGTTPIVMLSGNDAESLRQEALSAGANGFLRKPVALKELAQHIMTLLQKQ